MTVHYVDYISQLKSSVDLREVVEHYGMKPDRSGYINCPFHSEKTGSLKVWSDHFKCFGCGAHGDVISFVQDFLHTDFPGAMEAINNEFDLRLPFKGKLSLREIRAANAARRQVEEARTNRERVQAQRAVLDQLWAECDRVIMEHPVPDTEEVARAYSQRDYLSYLIDNFNSEDGYPDEFISA